MRVYIFGMGAPLQWRTAVVINAPKDRVWSIVDDVTLIPRYHPEVTKIDLLSQQRTRSVGMRYQCVVSHGARKGSCVEEVTEYVPGERMTTAFPEDTWGISKMLDEFSVETIVSSTPDGQTQLVLNAHYRPLGWRIRLANATFLRYAMARRAQRTLEGIKQLAESDNLR